MKSKTILLSIHPKHFNKIGRGIKKYEYRKYLPNDIDNVILYVTKPISKVVCIITKVEIVKAKPEMIWCLTKERSGITRDFFFKYFENKEIGYCLILSNIFFLLGKLQKLSYYGVNRPPQNFCYVKDTLIDDIFTIKK